MILFIQLKTCDICVGPDRYKNHNLNELYLCNNSASTQSIKKSCLLLLLFLLSYVYGFMSVMLLLTGIGLLLELKLIIVPMQPKSLIIESNISGLDAPDRDCGSKCDDYCFTFIFNFLPCLHVCVFCLHLLHCTASVLSNTLNT